MNPAQENAVRNGGYAAAHLAAICAMMATTLLADPDTAEAGEAVEGISQFARRLSNDLLVLCE